MTIFELIDAGDAEALRALLAREPEQAALHDDQGLTALMRAAYRGGEVFAAVRDADPPLEPFDRIMVGESDGLPDPMHARRTASRRCTWRRSRTTPKRRASSSRPAPTRTSSRPRSSPA